jgi:hypothetical protein
VVHDLLLEENFLTLSKRDVDESLYSFAVEISRGGVVNMPADAWKLW